MSSLFMDSIIFFLLVLGVGFGGISVIGLLLFPDIRSRMYTATRASLISAGAITVSVILYAIFILLSSSGSQYGTLILHSLILLIVVMAANVVMYRTISECMNIPTEHRGQTQQQHGDNPKK